MSAPYFQKNWPAFVFQGVIYSFDHLNEYQVEVIDSNKTQRQIAVTFSDHCFTREPEAGDDPALAYPPSTRRIGHFSVERYQLSLDLSLHLAHAMIHKVWIIRDGTFAIIPVVNHWGEKVFYGIVFSLDPVKGFPVHLHMRIETAYPCDESEIITFGIIRFAHLIALRMQRKNPNRNLDRHRPKPRLG